MGGKRNVGKIGKLKTKNSLLASVDEVGCVYDIFITNKWNSWFLIYLKINKKKTN